MSNGTAPNLTNSENPANANPLTSAAASSTAPVIQINGENPAVIHVGDTYNDLGATIVSPDADKNLGIKTFLNGKLVSNIVLDTTQVATDTVDYVVTDPAGLYSNLHPDRPHRGFRYGARMDRFAAGARSRSPLAPDYTDATASVASSTTH